MKNLIRAVVVAIGLMAGAAWAGDYSSEAHKQKKCNTAGELAQLHYGISKEQVKKALKEVQDETAAKKYTKKTGGDMQYIIFTGYRASSPKDAYMEAWAWCMDEK